MLILVLSMRKGLSASLKMFILMFLAINCCNSVTKTLGKEWTSSFYSTERLYTRVQLQITANLVRKDSLLSCTLHCQTLDVPSFYYIESDATCLCDSNDEEEKNANKKENSEREIVIGTRTEKVSTTYIAYGGQDIKRIHRQPELFDCLTLYDKRFHENGVYVINPTGSTNTDVWCDMSNGGWTVIQRRQDGSEYFYQKWEDYKNGFGNKFGEYWLGLENIHFLTIRNSSLYIYMETFTDHNAEPVLAFAGYSIFRINDENDKYRLTVGGYNGSCGDSLSYHDNCQFTTKDSDNDIYNTNFAVSYSGAWWYKACHYANLNGLYLGVANTTYGRGINWYNFWGHNYSLMTIVIKVRRNQ